mgnify:CR=1 FL=1
MLTDDELTAMRATIAAALPAACTITREGGAPVFDPNTGSYTPADPVIVYDGPCRVRTLHTQDMNVQIGDLPDGISRYVVTLPHTATGVARDQFLTVTDGTDPDLQGRPLRVTDVQYSEWGLGRRLIVEDRQG